jgi:hypothetical protein
MQRIMLSAIVGGLVHIASTTFAMFICVIARVLVSF